MYLKNKNLCYHKIVYILLQLMLSLKYMHVYMIRFQCKNINAGTGMILLNGSIPLTRPFNEMRLSYFLKIVLNLLQFLNEK